MAKGREKHQARLDAIQFFGKDLARRAKRKCELCEAGEDLRPYDTAPDGEPSLESLALLCERCRAVVDGREDDPRTLRFLEGAVWNETPVVAALAKRMLSELDVEWARDTLDMLPAEETDD
jgi:protein PhnA